MQTTFISLHLASREHENCLWMQKSWPLITLYYYASTRDREFFSSGDKCLAQGGPTMPPVENKEQKNCWCFHFSSPDGRCIGGNWLTRWRLIERAKARGCQMALEWNHLICSMTSRRYKYLTLHSKTFGMRGPIPLRTFSQGSKWNLNCFDQQHWKGIWSCCWNFSQL